MDSTNDRQRKDRLIQTRVPQNLESTLKDEARKRRLSVSHLIRNVLEDTFNLVDNVVNEVDRVVADSVGMAQTLKRDAQRLAATARGQGTPTTQRGHRERGEQPAVEGEALVDGASATVEAVVAVEEQEPGLPEAAEGAPVGELEAPPALPGSTPRVSLSAGVLASVYGFQELVLNKPAECASCGVAIARGARAFLGMTDEPGPRVWVCQDCVDSLSG